METTDHASVYELDGPTGRTSRIFLASFFTLLFPLILAGLWALDLSLARFVDDPSVRLLVLGAALLALGGAFAATRLWGGPRRWRYTVNQVSITAVLIDSSQQGAGSSKTAWFSDVETLWLPGWGNMLWLMRGRELIFDVGFNAFNHDAGRTFGLLVADLKNRLGIQEGQMRKVWWPPNIGGVKYPNPRHLRY